MILFSKRIIFSEIFSVWGTTQIQRKANVLKLIQKSSVFDGQLIRISVDARRY